MRNRIKVALSKFDRRTRRNPEAMFGFVSLLFILPSLFLLLFGPVFGRYFSPTFLSAYFGTFFQSILVPTVVIGYFFLNRVLRISKEIGRKRKSEGKAKTAGDIQEDEAEEV